jgi:hypothetical protein
MENPRQQVPLQKGAVPLLTYHITHDIMQDYLNHFSFH